jgi:hypothetical protein
VDGGGSMEILASAAAAEDCLIEGEIALTGGSGGVAFRLDHDGGGYFVELRPGSSAVSLQKWLTAEEARSGRREHVWQELQRADLMMPFPAGTAMPFRLLVVGPYIEVSLGGEAVLATFSGERLAGRGASGRGRAWPPGRCGSPVSASRGRIAVRRLESALTADGAVTAGEGRVQATEESAVERLRAAKGVVFDMDGVLYVGSRPLPGVRALLDALALRDNGSCSPRTTRCRRRNSTWNGWRRWGSRCRPKPS